ncbi:MAG: sugar transferase [Dysgonomonas sp.]
MEKLYTRKSFNLVVIFVDLLIIYSSIFLAYFIFKSDLEAYEENFHAFISISPYIGICYLIANHIFELDKPKDFSFFGIAYSVTLAIICLLLFTMAISFLTRKFAYPRSIMIFSSVFQIIFLSLWHLLVNRKFLKENIKKSVLIIGYEKSKELAYKLLRTSRMWSNIKHICEPDSKDLCKYIEECEVIFLSEDVDEIKKQDIIEVCVKNNRMAFYEPKNPEILLFNANFTRIDDVPILKVKPLIIGSGNRFMKRISDILLSIIAFAVFFIPILIISIAIKIGGGSVLYKQDRITRGRKIFKIYKFRTMVKNAESMSGPVLAGETDKRITKVGQVLRSTRMDELPQLINIIKGEMSIVGPRPERPFFVEQFKEEIPEYDLRHRVKAGLTGIAQIQGKYNTTVRDKLKYDLLYINSYSMALDIKLIMQTLNILFRKSSTEGVRKGVNYEEEIKKILKEDE